MIGPWIYKADDGQYLHWFSLTERGLVFEWSRQQSDAYRFSNRNRGSRFAKLSKAPGSLRRLMPSGYLKRLDAIEKARAEIEAQIARNDETIERILRFNRANGGPPINLTQPTDASGPGKDGGA